MAREDYPLCIYCDSYNKWFITQDGAQITYHCGGCNHSVVVELSDD
jgi:hypothetical protein